MLILRRFLRYIFAFGPSKWLFNTLLPKYARRKISSGLDLDTGPLNRPIEDVELIAIQPDGYLAVYFKRYGADVGPGVSLYVLQNEILRFDCFGDDRGHYHSLPCLSAIPSSEQINFTGRSIDAQIDEASTEIHDNYAAHLTNHFRRRIREFRFDKTCLDKAVADARNRMRCAHSLESSRAP